MISAVTATGMSPRPRSTVWPEPASNICGPIRSAPKARLPGRASSPDATPRLSAWSGTAAGLPRRRLFFCPTICVRRDITAPTNPKPTTIRCVTIRPCGTAAVRRRHTTTRRGRRTSRFLPYSTRWPPIWGASVPIIPTSGGISPSKGLIRRGWNCRRTCPTFRKSGLTSRFIWRGRRTSTHGSGCFSTISGGSGSMKIRSSFSSATMEDACPAARGSSMRPGPTCRSSSTCLRNGGIWPTVSPAGPTG